MEFGALKNCQFCDFSDFTKVIFAKLPIFFSLKVQNSIILNILKSWYSKIVENHAPEEVYLQTLQTVKLIDFFQFHFFLEKFISKSRKIKGLNLL